MPQLLERAPGFDDLGVEDQIDLVESLWDRIAADERRVPVPQWHREILDQRLAALEARPEEGRAWEDVETDLRARLAGR